MKIYNGHMLFSTEFLISHTVEVSHYPTHYPSKLQITKWMEGQVEAQLTVQVDIIKNVYVCLIL